MPVHDSANIRRQIGLFRRQLQRYGSTVADIFKEYRIEPSKPVLSQLSNEELECFRSELASVKRNLLKVHNKIVKLHDEWTTFQASDPAEQKIFEDYVAKYGDYRTDIASAVNSLEQCDAVLNILDTEYVKRELNPPSDLSDVTPIDDEDYQRDTRMGTKRNTTRSIPPASDAPLLNFVDASILAKLELPTFAGNLLDFPEFSARFATLVANKGQLDDTTKFSLLKSCLRGRALESIQGLSMTAENYHIAMDILKTLYDDKVTVRHILFTKLAQLPPCDPEGRRLPMLYNQMFSLVRQFSNNHDDSSETALGALLLNKLPLRVRSLVYDRTSNDHNVSPSELLHLLTDIVRKDSTLFEMEYHARPVAHLRNPSQAFHVALNKTSRSRKVPSEKKKYRKCLLCNSTTHSTIECDTYPTAKDRIEQVKLRKLCLNCLSTSHSTRNCTSKFLCMFCSKRHHSSLCFRSSHLRTSSTSPTLNSQTPTQSTRRQNVTNSSHRSPKSQNHTMHVEETKELLSSSSTPNEQPFNSQANVPAMQAPVTCSTNSTKTLTTQTALMCTTVTLFNPNDPSYRTTATAFLDSGSNKSYITDEIAARLHLLTTGNEHISLSTFGKVESLELECQNYVIGLYTEKGVKHLQVKSIPLLTGNLQRVEIPEGTTSDVTFSLCKPSILIGNDYFWDIILSEDFHHKTLSKNYRILHTAIGDMIVGRAFNAKNCTAYAALFTEPDSTASPSNHKELVDLVSNFWKLETIGILDDPAQKDDEQCLKYFNDTAYYDKEQRRYVVRLPFKIKPSELPSNFSLAYSRLCSQHRSLQQNVSYLEKYHAIFKDQLERQIIERVPTNDITNSCHYLSHHGVLKKDGENIKIRCVFDGSAKLKGHHSINDILHRGPVLLPDLTGILLRSRFCKILVSSDIEKAFLMVGLHKDSRDYTRFLWLNDPMKPISSENLVTYRFTRVPFGLICSPFLLAGTIHLHLSSATTNMARHLLRNTYVDNIFYGVDSIKDGVVFYKESKELFFAAGMNLRAYASNSKELNTFFEKNENSKIQKIQKLLGLRWNTENDTLIISLPEAPENNFIWTKRKVLKHIAQIYDPIGLFSPVLLIGKLFLQSLWKINLSWDEALPNEHINKWHQIISSWTTPDLTLPRLIIDLNNFSSDFDIHVFTDASASAYCAVAYIVQRHMDTPTKVSLVMSKSRLAPLNQSITIPRLELAALMIGAKLLTYISKQLDLRLSKKYLWTDSIVTLAWTKSNKDLPIFIRNRVRIIRENTIDVTLRHIPGELNPADVGTRGTTIDELLKLTQWWNGPEFLMKKPESWPSNLLETFETKNADTTNEREKSEDSPCSSIAISTFSSNQNDDCDKWRNMVMNVSRFSTWTKLVNTLAYVLKFITNKIPRTTSLFGSSKVALLNNAEIIIFRLAQSMSPPSDEHKRQLHLFQCTQTSIWKSKGRIDHADLPSEAITPIYLPRSNRITSLFVLHMHQTNNHCGVNHTLTLCRLRVWIPQGRAVVKKIIHRDCYQCKRYQAKPYVLPPFPVHPDRRVRMPLYPFQNTGMDFFGPLPYRTQDQSIGNYWMLLFTCLNCRAIYVDTLLDMSAHTVLHILRRFFATMGCPSWIICDNAQSFKTINRCFTSLPEPHVDSDIIDYCSKRRIEMKFIPSLSPWQGGMYEKMVDIFKKSYKFSIGNNLLNIEDIKTLAKETEAIVNTRPLTYYVDESNYLPLRPIDFIRPYTLLSSIYPEDQEEDWIPYPTTHTTLLAEWSRTNKFISNFWQRWTTEYLTTMREHYKDKHNEPRSHENAPPKKGDFVLIHDEYLNRGQWKMGEVIGSKDNYQRSVEIRLPSKGIITRPNNLVHKMELGPEQTPSLREEDRPASPPNDRSQSRHPMMTRSKTRLQANSIFLCLSLLFSLAMGKPQTIFGIYNTSIEANHNRCPEDFAVEKTVLYATNCVPRGIAIARIHVDGNPLCWFPVLCPLGHIRFQANSSTLCGKECECPSWTTTCSFSDSSYTTLSYLERVPPSFLHYQPNYVCSFESSTSCDSVKRLELFNQVQLYDDTLLLVENLVIDIRDYIDENDFLCIDKKGWKRQATKFVTGTSQFCKTHKCSSKARLFCAYDNPLALLVLNATSNLTIPIKAWGSIAKTYYGYPNTAMENNHRRNDDALISNTNAVIVTDLQLVTETVKSELVTNCSKGGLFLAINSRYEFVEACIEQYCVFFEQVPAHEIIFPNLIVLYDYTVTVTVWISSESHTRTLHCKAHPICEMLLCYFCLERLYNTQCWTLTEMALVFVGALLTLLILPWILLTIKIVAFFLKIIRNLLKCTYYCLRNVLPVKRQPEFQPPRHNFPKYVSKRQRIKKKELLLSLFVLIELQHAQGCSQVTSITATEKICVLFNHSETCTFDEATIMTLQPLSQETCLALKDHQGVVLAMLSIKIDGIRFKCHKNIEFFTRDHQLKSESIHRCYLAGSCQENTCDNTSPKDKLKEISDTANNHPGYTYCSSSCGCLTCGGCFMCQPSCLFYRIYATPTSSTIYHVFTCPSWEVVVDAVVTLREDSSEPSSTVLKLYPGQTSLWNHMKFTLTSTINPQLPILSSTFISTGKETSIVEPAHKGQMTPKGAGQLQCPSQSHAKEFKCTFASKACTCTNGLHKASCVCSSGDMRKLMKNSPLPLLSKSYAIFNQNGEVHAKASVGSALQIQVVAENMKIIAQQTHTTCEVEVSDLIGCYSCIAGAELPLSCKSKGGDTLANILCPSENQVARCTTNGFLNKIKFHFNTSKISMKCVVSCPGGKTDISVYGHLHYISNNLIEEDLRVDSEQSGISEDFSYLITLGDQAIDSFVNFVVYFPKLVIQNIKVILLCIICCFFYILLMSCKRTLRFRPHHKRH